MSKEGKGYHQDLCIEAGGEYRQVFHVDNILLLLEELVPLDVTGFYYQMVFPKSS